MIVEKLLKIALLGSSWVLWLLLGLSVLSGGQILERWLYFRRHRDPGDTLRDALEEALLADDFDRAQKALAKSRTIEATVLTRALRWKEGGPEAFADAVESEFGRTRAELERGMNLLGTLGSNAPFIGLFGTVIGVIEAFNHLGSAAARAGAMGNVMAGIAEALVATAVGIFVAVPAVVAYNVAQKRLGDIEAETSALAKLFTAWLKTSDRRGLHYRSAAPAENRSSPARAPSAPAAT